MRKKSNHKREIVRSDNQHIVVRRVRRAEPDYDKYAKALIAHAIEQQRKKNPDSVRWYDNRYPYRSKNGEI